MAVKKKKIGAAGRFRAGYGKPKQRLVAVESIQRKRQACPFCKGTAKRQAKAIWLCRKCRRKFAAGTFHLKEKD